MGCPAAMAVGDGAYVIAVGNLGSGSAKDSKLELEDIVVSRSGIEIKSCRRSQYPRDEAQ